MVFSHDAGKLHTLLITADAKSTPSYCSDLHFLGIIMRFILFALPHSFSRWTLVIKQANSCKTIVLEVGSRVHQNIDYKAAALSSMLWLLLINVRPLTRLVSLQDVIDWLLPSILDLINIRLLEVNNELNKQNLVSQMTKIY